MSEILNSNETDVQIHELLNSEDSSYLEYATYTVLDRALPYLTDGFKPTQRKIMYVSLLRAKTKKINVSALAGYVKAESQYHHSDSSLPDQIINLAQPFKSAIPYYERFGQFGDVYSPSAAAPRYLEVKLSDAFKLLFMDNDLIEEQWEEGYKIEPVTYFPILPTVLLNPIQGIALGYSFNSTPRSPIDLLETTVKLLHNKKVDSSKPIAPYIDGLTGKWVWHTGNQKWEHHGFMEVKNTTTVEITGLPYGTEYSAYEWHLNCLCEEGYMEDFTNNTRNGKISYELKFTRAKLEQHINEDSLYHKLKMYTRLDKDVLAVINSKGEPYRFDNDIDLVQEFVDWRLTIYAKRRLSQIENLTIERNYYNEVIRFIELIVSGEIKIDKIKSKSSLIELLTETHNFTYSDKLAELKVYKLTIEEIEKYLAKIADITALIEYYEVTTEADLYLLDLENLKSELTAAGYSKQKYEIWD